MRSRTAKLNSAALALLGAVAIVSMASCDTHRRDTSASTGETERVSSGLGGMDASRDGASRGIGFASDASLEGNGGGEQDFVQVADDSGVRQVVVFPTRTMASKPAGGPPKPSLPVRPPGGVAPIDALRAHAAAQEASTRIIFSIALDDPKTDWTRISRATSQSARNAAIVLRKSQVGQGQQSVVQRVSMLGGKILSAHWLANGLIVELPASAVAVLLSHPDVRDAYLPRPTKPLTGHWEGDTARLQLRTGNLLNAGVRGHSGSIIPSAGRIKIGVVESFFQSGHNWPPVAHAGWQRTDRPGSRVVVRKQCTAAGCFDHSASGAGSSAGGGHGTFVAMLAGGSIEEGQDAAYTGAGTTNQLRRSGQVPEAYIKYYLSQNGLGYEVVNGVEAAVEDGVDVINMSFEDGNGECDSTTDDTNFNEVLVNSLNAGVLFVGAAGNYPRSMYPGQCKVAYPAYRPEVLAVGQLNSTSSIVSGVFYLAKPYTALAIRDDSSQGGVPVAMYAAGSGTLSGIAFMGPGCFDYSYNIVGGTNHYDGNGCGTSYASPVVAGMVGLLRNAWWSIGWPKDDARLMMANALLMGDSWDGTTVRTGSTSPDVVTGTGRPRIHWPSSADLVAPWGWGQHAATIHQGETITWPVGPGTPLPSGVTLWKWSALYTWNDPLGGAGGLQNIPDVDFFVDDVCSGTTTLHSDQGTDVRARFRLSQSQLTGHCLQMRAYGFSVPPGGVNIYSADYYHSGDPSVH